MLFFFFVLIVGKGKDYDCFDREITREKYMRKLIFKSNLYKLCNWLKQKKALKKLDILCSNTKRGYYK